MCNAAATVSSSSEVTLIVPSIPPSTVCVCRWNTDPELPRPSPTSLTCCLCGTSGACATRPPKTLHGSEIIPRPSLAFPRPDSIVFTHGICFLCPCNDTVAAITHSLFVILMAYVPFVLAMTLSLLTLNTGGCTGALINASIQNKQTTFEKHDSGGLGLVCLQARMLTFRFKQIPSTRPSLSFIFFLHRYKKLNFDLELFFINTDPALYVALPPYYSDIMRAWTASRARIQFTHDCINHVLNLPVNCSLFSPAADDGASTRPLSPPSPARHLACGITHIRHIVNSSTGRWSAAKDLHLKSRGPRPRHFISSIPNSSIFIVPSSVFFLPSSITKVSVVRLRLLRLHLVNFHHLRQTRPWT